MESLLGALAGFLILLLLIGLAIYIVTSIFLNKFNKLVYGKGTAMAWIPVFNVYLLGKLAVNKLVGWILVICIFITGTYTISINDSETTYTILPENINSIVSNVYSLAVLGLLVYAIVKYYKLKNNSSSIEQSIPQQRAQSTMNQQQTLESQNVINDQSNNQNSTNSSNL